MNENIKKQFFEAMERAPSGKLGLSVSGGGDSVALLHLACSWAKKTDTELAVITIDHNLREESVLEANFVKSVANFYGIDHQTYMWKDKPKGNLQNLARNARHQITANWAKGRELAAVLLGHTKDDQEETLMLRMLRGSGVDGMKGISETVIIGNLLFFRPLLSISREQLRNYLRSKNLDWREDPSNADDRFDRVKVRNILSEMNKLGLQTSRLVSMSRHMTRASVALDNVTLELATSCMEQKDWGDLNLDKDCFSVASYEIQLRLLSKALCWVSGKTYKPRFTDLEKLCESIICSKQMPGRSLMGVIIRTVKGKIIFTREFSSLPKGLNVTSKTLVWDNRWELEVLVEKKSNLTISPLGEKSLILINNWKKSHIPREALVGSPSLFEGGNLICSPMASFGSGLHIKLLGGNNAFFNSFEYY